MQGTVSLIVWQVDVNVGTLQKNLHCGQVASGASNVERGESIAVPNVHITQTGLDQVLDDRTATGEARGRGAGVSGLRLVAGKMLSCQVESSLLVARENCRI